MLDFFSSCKVFNAFVISIELWFKTIYIIFFTDAFVWGPFFRSLKAKTFALGFRLTGYMLLSVQSNKEQTTEKRFVNAVNNIWMPEINSMIHLKTSFEYLR